MAWKNAKNKTFTLFLVFVMALPVLAIAKRLEKQPLWRVESAVPAEKAPDYQKSETPFNMKPEPPKKEKVVRKPRVTSASLEELEKQRRSRLAGQLLDKIRSAISEDEIFRPDVSMVRISGRILGESGYRILVNNHWISVGDIILVPAMARDDLWALVEELEGLDSDLSADVITQIEERVSAAEDMNLSVQSITTQGVNLRNEDGVEYTLSLDFMQ